MGERSAHPAITENQRFPADLWCSASQVFAYKRPHVFGIGLESCKRRSGAGMIGRIDGFGEGRSVPERKGANTPRRALQRVGDMPPGFGVPRGQDRLKARDEFVRLLVKQA